MPLFTISQHELQTYKNCGKKHEYGFERGLEVPDSHYKAPLHFGTDLHAMLRAGYTLQQASPKDHTLLRVGGMLALDSMTAQAVALDKYDRDYYNNLEDVFNYYTQFYQDEFDEIISVEKSFAIEVEDVEITGTFDLLTRRNGRIGLWDHKTTGNIKQSLALLPHNFQLWLYNLIVFREFGEPCDTVWNLIRQEVPPGFGRREVRLKKDGKPAANNASQDPRDYLRREPVRKTAFALEAFERDDLAATIRQLKWSKREGVFVRSESSFGPNACPSCPYFDLCKRERSGRTIDEATLRQLYPRKEDATKENT